MVVVPMDQPLPKPPVAPTIPAEAFQPMPSIWAITLICRPCVSAEL
jgi:hypothetical protein